MKKGYPSSCSVRKKNPLMFSLIIFCWLLTILYFNPRLLALLIGPENILAKFAIIGFTLLLNLFWFYGFYHLIIILFSYFPPRWISDKNATIVANQVRDTNLSTEKPAVALLYTTCNDFKEEAVLSCLNQGYQNSHTFILDDSNDEEYKRKIDEFAAQYHQKVSVMRRRNKKGYKAGNINYGLSKITGVEFFSISDADTILPEDYISKLLSYFNDPAIAFVQAKQVINPRQKSTFAQYLGFQIGLHCDRYLRTKNKYGFVMFYGHGALMRVDVWKEIGSMPEVATEDLAYSMRVREKGYVGVYAEDVVCYEDYPSMYQQYRKRNEKWIRGTAECLLKFYPNFLKSKYIGWVEKFDVFVSAFSLLLAFPFFVLLLLVGVILPFYFYHFRFQGPMFQMPVVYDGSLLNLTVGISGNLFWKWDFFLLLLIALISPILPAIIEIFQYPNRRPAVAGKRFRYIVMYTFMFYAMQITSSLNLIAYFISRTAGFPVTGQKKEYSERRKKPENFKQFISMPIANHKITVGIEGIFAVLFFAISMATDNIWFLSFGAGMVISILLFKLGFENRFLKYLVVVPLIITVIIALFIGKTLQ